MLASYPTWVEEGVVGRCGQGLQGTKLSPIPRVFSFRVLLSTVGEFEAGAHFSFVSIAVEDCVSCYGNKRRSWGEGKQPYRRTLELALSKMSEIEGFLSSLLGIL